MALLCPQPNWLGVRSWPEPTCRSFRGRPFLTRPVIRACAVALSLASGICNQVPGTTDKRPGHVVLRKSSRTAATASFGASWGWRQPRNPARHISPKALVLRAECLLERRFFDHHHPDMKKKPE